MTEYSEHEDGEGTDLRQLPVLSYYEERRRYPRVDLRVPVIISSHQHKVLRARTRNISAEGLQIRCDRETSRALHPSGTPIPPKAGPSVMLRLDLTLHGQVRRFVAEGRLVYIAVCRSDEIAFGLQFTQIALAHRATLAEFIMESLRPRE